MRASQKRAAKQKRKCPHSLGDTISLLPIPEKENIAMFFAGTAMQTISRTMRIQYASGSFGTGVFSTVPSVLLLFYCTQTLGLDPAAVAVVLLVPKLVSLVWDPMVGSWSDATLSRWGRRKPFLLIGALGTSALFMALFNPIGETGGALLIWVAIAYTALSLLYSVFAVPYTALPADLSEDEAGVLSLVSARMMVLMVGILTGGAIAPVVVEAFGGGRTGYSAMGIVIGAFTLLFMIQPAFMKSGKLPAPDPSRRVSIQQRFQEALGQLRAVLANRPYLLLLMSFVLQALAYGGVSAAFPFLATIALGRPESDIGTGLGLLILASFVAVPAWSALAKRIGLGKSIALAVLGYAAGALLLFAAIAFLKSWHGSLAALGITGLFFAGLQVLPFSLAAEVARRSAPGKEAQYAGVWIAFEKAGLAGGAFFLSLMISWVGSSNAPLIYIAAVTPVLLLISIPLALACGRWLVRNES